MGTNEELDELAKLCTGEAEHARIRTGELAGLIASARRWAKAEEFFRNYGDLIRFHPDDFTLEAARLRAWGELSALLTEEP